MLYNGADEFDKKKAVVRLKHFLDKGVCFELTEKRNLGSDNQLRYLHLILGWFAIEYGDTIEYVKQEIFKKIVNPDIFFTEKVNRKTGEIREDWRSVNDLDTKELSSSITKFRNYSVKDFGHYLPAPNERPFLIEIEKQIKINREWI